MVAPTECMAPGAGADLWRLADKLRGRDPDDPITSLADERAMERMNALLSVVKSNTTRAEASPFRKTAVVNPTSGAALRLLTEVVGPDLAAGLLVRAGCELSFAREIAAEASGDSRWARRMAQAEVAWSWDGPPYIPPPKAEGLYDIHEFVLGGVEGWQVRALAGLDSTTVVLPSSVVGSLWGISVAYEEIEDQVAGRMVRKRGLGGEAEIVLNIHTCSPQRVLALLLAAWMLNKQRDPRIGDEYQVLEADLVVDADEVEPIDAETRTMTVVQATADWLVLPLERMVLELRARRGSFHDEVALIALQLRLPVSLVGRCGRRVLDMIHRGVAL